MAGLRDNTNLFLDVNSDLFWQYTVDFLESTNCDNLTLGGLAMPYGDRELGQYWLK